MCKLTDNEIAFLRELVRESGKRYTSDELAEKLNVHKSVVQRTAHLLNAKHLIAVEPKRRHPRGRPVLTYYVPSQAWLRERLFAYFKECIEKQIFGENSDNGGER